MEHKGRNLYKSAKNFSNKKKTFTSKKKLNEMAKDPAVIRQQRKDAKSYCKGRDELKQCRNEYIKKRLSSRNVIDDFNKVNMQRKADTIQQRAHLENQTVKTNIKADLDKFKTTQAYTNLPSEQDKFNMLKKEEKRLQQKSYDSFKQTPEAIDERRSLINKERKNLDKFSLFSRSNALDKSTKL